MGIKRKLLFIFCLIVFFGHLVFAQNTDVEGAKDHPQVLRLKNFYIANYEEHRFDFENFKTTDGAVRVEGHKLVIDYRLQPGLSPIGKNFILDSFQKSLNSPATDLMLNGPYYSVFKITKSGLETWVKIDPLNTDGERYILTIVEKEKMSQEISTKAIPLGNKNPNDIEGSKDYPLLPRMPDFYIGSYEETIQVSETFKTTSGDIETNGHKFYIDYYLEDGKIPPGKIQILENYRTSLTNSGAEILLDGAYFDVYKLQNSEGEAWIKIDPGVYDGKRYQVTVIEKSGNTEFTENESEVIRTDLLTVTGLNPEDRVIKTSMLQMRGLNPTDRIINTISLTMTGLNPENRIIKTNTLLMTGLD